MENIDIHIGGRMHVPAQAIRLLQADINYTLVHFTDGSKTLVSTTMGTIESRLPKGVFLRINRNTVINRSEVLHYFIRPRYDEIKLDDATYVKVSRRRRIELRKELKIVQ
jgi:DNA-binding LytR/AlgR family response regulator